MTSSAIACVLHARSAAGSQTAALTAAQQQPRRHRSHAPCSFSTSALAAPPLPLLAQPCHAAIPREARRGATEAQVKADKAAFAAAAADPEAAFAAQAAALTAMAAAAAAAGVAPPPEAAALTSDPAKARATFLESLKEIAALNAASGPTLAYGITPFTHLTDEEFRRLFLSGVRQGNDPQAAMGEPTGRRAGVRVAEGQGPSWDASCLGVYGGCLQVLAPAPKRPSLLFAWLRYTP